MNDGVNEFLYRSSLQFGILNYWILGSGCVPCQRQEQRLRMHSTGNSSACLRFGILSPLSHLGTDPCFVNSLLDKGDNEWGTQIDHLCCTFTSLIDCFSKITVKADAVIQISMQWKATASGFWTTNSNEVKSRDRREHPPPTPLQPQFRGAVGVLWLWPLTSSLLVPCDGGDLVERSWTGCLKHPRL